MKIEADRAQECMHACAFECAVHLTLSMDRFLLFFFSDKCNTIHDPVKCSNHFQVKNNKTMG